MMSLAGIDPRHIPIAIKETYISPFFAAYTVTFPPFIDAAELVPFLTPPIINPNDNELLTSSRSSIP